MESYAELLRARGLKVTAQRLEIMRYLDKHRGHPTADMIFRDLRKMHPSLSRATVYNTMDTLRKESLVTAVRVEGPELHYDYIRDAHHHFQCRECGAIIDIMIDCPFLDSMLKGEHRIEEVHGNFVGVCKECCGRLGIKVGAGCCDGKGPAK